MRDELLYVPDPCVEPIIADVANFYNTAAATSHGVGKTTAAANILLTASVLVPELVVIQISPTWRQVKGIFWNEVRKWYNNSQLCQAMFEIADKAPKMSSRMQPEHWYAEGLASNSPQKIEGKHGKSVLKIIDEAKAVEDAMIEASQGAMTSELLAWELRVSTPSTPGGKFTRFYLCFTRDRDIWKTHKITALQSPRVSKKWIAMMKREYGEDSQIFRARAMAEFPEAGEDILIPLQVAELFYDDEADLPKGAWSIGVDIARFGGDECAVSVWKGLILVELHIFEHKRVTETFGFVDRLVKEKDARCVVVDDIGIGSGLTDLLVQKEYHKCQIIPFIANEAAARPDVFKSMGDEVWWEFAKNLKEKKCRSMINDDKLIYQLSSYKKDYTLGKGLIVVNWPERKADRTSESKSPDRGDAVILGWFGAMQMATEMFESEREKESGNDEDDDEGSGDMETENITRRSF